MLVQVDYSKSKCRWECSLGRVFICFRVSNGILLEEQSTVIFLLSLLSQIGITTDNIFLWNEFPKIRRNINDWCWAIIVPIEFAWLELNLFLDRSILLRNGREDIVLARIRNEFIYPKSSSDKSNALILFKFPAASVSPFSSSSLSSYEHLDILRYSNDSGK